MEIHPYLSDLPGDAPPGWVRVTPCERDALERLRRCLREREDAGGRVAVAGLGLFSLRQGGAVVAYLSPATVAVLAGALDGLETAPSLPPPDDPGLKLEVGDRELWKSIVQPIGGRFFEA